MVVDVALAVVEREGQVLVGERPVGVPLAGYSEFPGGKVEAGESTSTAAVRECFEETGLEVAADSCFPPIEHVYEHATVRLHFVLCRVIHTNSPAPLAPFRWVQRSELTSLRFPEANLPFLHAFLATT